MTIRLLGERQSIKKNFSNSLVHSVQRAASFKQ